MGHFSLSPKGYESWFLLINKTRNIVLSVFFAIFHTWCKCFQRPMCWNGVGSSQKNHHSLERFALLGKTLEGRVRAKGRKFEKCKFLNLFKEALSNNLCSPKMELAFWSSLSIPAGAGWQSVGDRRTGPAPGWDHCFALWLETVGWDELITLGEIWTHWQRRGLEPQPEAWSFLLRKSTGSDLRGSPWPQGAYFFQFKVMSVLRFTGFWIFLRQNMQTMPNIITEGVSGDGWKVSQKLSEQH